MAVNSDALSALPAGPMDEASQVLAPEAPADDVDGATPAPVGAAPAPLETVLPVPGSEGDDDGDVYDADDDDDYVGGSPDAPATVMGAEAGAPAAPQQVVAPVAPVTPPVDATTGGSGGAYAGTDDDDDDDDEYEFEDGDHEEDEDDD